MKKFTDITQFRNIIRDVKSQHDYKGKDESGEPIFSHETPYPTLHFRGTCKCHGTNAGIAKYKDGHYEFQSRENVLSLEKDNAGFFREMQSKDYPKLFEDIEFEDSCVIYGEWCGKGIQKGVAVSELPKSFIIFAVRIDEVYQDLANFTHLKTEDQNIYNILQFQTFNVEVDFNNPEISQNKIIELTLEVEDECPVGLHFGIHDIGEGIVFEYLNGEERHIFKSKGLKHSQSKVKTLKTLDTDAISILKGLAEQVTPEWRLEQMLTEICNLNNGGFINRIHLGAYIKAVIADIQKEDMDLITEAGFELKDVGRYVSEIAKLYFFEKEKI